MSVSKIEVYHSFVFNKGIRELRREVYLNDL